MTSPDYITLAIYLAGIFLISTIASRRTRNQRDMFAAGNRSPWWVSGLSGFMTMFSAGTFVVWGGIAYELGLVAVLINICYGIAALLVGYRVAGRWNELGVSTPAEFVQLRFGTKGLHFFTWTMLLKRILGVSVSLYALAVLLVTLMPLDLNLAIILFGVIVIVYTMQGGLWAVLMTDVLQFIVLTVVVLFVAILMMGQTQWDAFTAAVPPSFFSPVAGSYGWLFLAGWVTIHFFMIGAEWAFVQRFLAVRNPAEARKSSWLFGTMYLVTPLFWLLPPLLYRGQVAGIDKEQAYILAARSVLPPGVLGLMVAAMFSATASMVSSQLNVFAGVLTNDFYRALLNPRASERVLLKTGRLFTVLLGLVLVLTALLVPHLGGAEKLIISINSLLVVPLFAPTLWGLFSRKIGLRDLLTVALTSFLLGLGLKFGLAGNPFIAEGSALSTLARLLSDHSKNVDVLVGVILPVGMLALIEWRKQGLDSRADALRLRARANPDEEPPDPGTFDPFPLQMVLVSLLAIGTGMLFLGLSAISERTILVCFGGVLLTIAGGCHLVQSKNYTKS
ncbi:MAG: Na+:solute symporter [Verrucomicrobiota bacterium]